MAAHLLMFSPLPPPISIDHHRNNHFLLRTPISASPSQQLTSRSSAIRSKSLDIFRCSTDGGSTGGWSGGGGGGGGNGDREDPDQSSDGSDSPRAIGPLGFFINGWRSRVNADSQFPFKVLMEEIVGVSSCIIGDMASRPNFGLNELDFVFSTLVVGSILNFVLMYLLAPTATSAASSLPGLFSRCPTSHMFESGAYSMLNRIGTFVYKGALFGTVGFAAGLMGTALSNGLIGLRKKMDPGFETTNQAPPTILNALTWALHMGVNSNFRYQTLNGVEFWLAKTMSPGMFKANVVLLRCLNNILGGVTFVVTARMTGSQQTQKTEDLVE